MGTDLFISSGVSDEERKVLQENLMGYNLHEAPPVIPERWIRIDFCLKNEKGEIVAGILSALGYWAALEIYLLWVNNDYRKQGIGTRLLQKAEAIAIENGALLSLTDTFSFHAPEFYLKNGYEVFGELDNFPQGKKRYYLKKKLGRKV